MNIAVCIKQVPGTSEVEVDEKTGVLKRDGVDSKMNPYDLYALETALRLRQEHGGIISVISMGPPQSEEVIREAFMMGADDGVLLSDRRFAGADVLATAYTLSAGLQRLDDIDLIICGKQTTDGDTAQVGSEIAEFLNIPHVANVRRICGVGAKAIVVEMDMPETVEIAEVSFPCLITVEKDINTPRLPSFKLKLATEGRTITTLGLDDFVDKDENNYGLNGSPTQVVKIFPPPTNDCHKIFEGDPVRSAYGMYQYLNDNKFIEAR
ncbi:electron transfer flavoprotein subunit beta/FixA family protein [Lentisphaerota bacterium ZTH]|nr:electron transfer flavoprotein subunit beta/FixA family protein [Lentisphaerota bacterium]WET07228.1 electron transfer flavoprotein subunit beta/FixA family protein [Lentisphaerota bacterium ZTH]